MIFSKLLFHREGITERILPLLWLLQVLTSKLGVPETSLHSYKTKMILVKTKISF